MSFDCPGWRIPRPHGLLQTRSNPGGECGLSAMVANHRWDVVDYDKRVFNIEMVADKPLDAVANRTDIAFHHYCGLLRRKSTHSFGSG